MAYSVKFKRKKNRPPSGPMTPERAAKKVAIIVVVALVAWAIVQGCLYVHYAMPFPYSDAVWGRQFGSPGNDDAEAVTVDRHGNVFVAGSTDDSLFAQSSMHNDAFLSKYNAVGQFLWGHQYQCAGDETIGGIAADSQGNVYLVGGTEGSLFGKMQAGSNSENPAHEAFIAKIDSSGKQIWAVQFGAGGDDGATGVAVDQRDNVYVCGDTDGNLFDTNADPLAATPYSPRTSDVWEVKYSPGGTRAWNLQFGAAGDDEAEAIAVDASGESFIVGGTHGLFRPYVDDRDAFLAKITSAGALAWGQQMPVRQHSFPAGVSCDAAGNSYLAADMVFGEGILHASPAVAEFASTGIIRQRTEMPLNLNLDVLTATPDSRGGLVLVGSTDGHAGASEVSGQAGVYRYNSTGKCLWKRQLPGSASTLFDAAFVDPGGYIYAVGKTEDSLYAKAAGSDDAIVVKLTPHGKTQEPIKNHAAMHSAVASLTSSSAPGVVN